MPIQYIYIIAIGGRVDRNARVQCLDCWSGTDFIEWAYNTIFIYLHVLLKNWTRVRVPLSDYLSHLFIPFLLLLLSTVVLLMIIMTQYFFICIHINIYI